MGSSLALAQVLALALATLWVGGESDTSTGCPCSNQNLCQPLAADNQPQVEVFVSDLGGTDWKRYDWSKVTTVAPMRKWDPEILCHAHANDVRVVLNRALSAETIRGIAKRTAWINGKLQVAKRQFMDGIVLNYHQRATIGSPLHTGLIELIRETAQIFRREIPGAQVSFSIPWSPDCIEGQCYDFVTIAKYCDFVFVRSFNMHTQTLHDCFAKPNAPYHQTLSGLSAYINLGIDSRKLLLGIAWQGYDYTCTHLIEPGRCELAKNTHCSYKAAKQVHYKDIMKRMPKSITGKYWDDDHKAPYFVYLDNNIYHEVWYDDPESISIKASIMKKLKLRGIGIWAGSFLKYSDDPIAAMQTEEMWNALCPF